MVVFVHLSLLCESRLIGYQRSLGFATLVSEVGYDRIMMSRQSEIPLPEITREDFKRAWTRFELVAKVKEWDDNKQLAVIPTLLCGKLLDAFVELPAGSKDSLENLKKALSE